MTADYVHGYTGRENDRLRDQASTLETLLLSGVVFPPGALVLEPGCGVGAQTIPLAANNPQTRFVSVDLSADSVRLAEKAAAEAGLTNVRFEHGDLFSLPFQPATFDHLFICFVLEHLSRPLDALIALRRLLKPGGTVVVIEGDHGSTSFHPDCEAARRAVAHQVALQKAAGGDAEIGRRLFPLLGEAGFDEVSVSPRQVYVDGSRPDLADGFTRKTFAAMIEGVRDKALAAGLTTPEDFDAGVRGLLRAAEPDGVFCYTFFKAVGVKPVGNGDGRP